MKNHCKMKSRHCCDCCDCSRGCDCCDCGCGCKKNCGCGNNCDKTCCLLEIISSLLCNKHEDHHKHQKGSMVFVNGHHEVKISTKHEPNEVYISLVALDAPVCVGDVDVAGVKIMPDGFVLYADIKSSECKVKWIAKFGC